MLGLGVKQHPGGPGQWTRAASCPGWGGGAEGPQWAGPHTPPQQVPARARGCDVHAGRRPPPSPGPARLPRGSGAGARLKQGWRGGNRGVSAPGLQLGGLGLPAGKQGQRAPGGRRCPDGEQLSAAGPPAETTFPKPLAHGLHSRQAGDMSWEPDGCWCGASWPPRTSRSGPGVPACVARPLPLRPGPSSRAGSRGAWPRPSWDPPLRPQEPHPGSRRPLLALLLPASFLDDLRRRCPQSPVTLSPLCHSGPPHVLRNPVWWFSGMF